MKKYTHIWKNLLVLALALVFAVPASIDFLAMHRQEEVVQTSQLTEVKMLSEYCEGLKGSDLDTEIYMFDSGVPGGTFLVLGGTHPNESAGMMSAIAMIENIQVTAGKVYIIPWTNKSGFTHTSPLDGMLDRFSITLADGSQRTFRVGNRLTNPVDQWPDRNFYEGSSGRKLVGTETAEIRNVNRLYPGNENGVLTERVCAGIKNLINEENVSIVMDMHEGSPEFLYLDTTMAHERALDVASLMAMDMSLEGLNMKAELSGMTSYGLSHRSLGDNTSALMTLMETYNPSMGPLHGKMDDDLIVNGNEPNYYEAHKQGYIYYNVKENGIPLIERIARHITCISLLKDAYNTYHADAPIEFTCIGSYSDMMDLGLENIFKPLS